MSPSILISLVVVVIAFALFFFFSFKGVNLFLTVFACVTLVSLCTADGLTAIFTSFLPSVGTMFQQFFLLYTIGGAFGFCLMESGLGSAMAVHMIRIFGEKWIAVALFVITCLMMAAGVASYQSAILAIALPVLKRLNMSRKVALAAMSAGAGSVAYGTLIGMPNALNIAPTTYLGTTTMASPVISLVCTAFSVAFIVGYLMLLTNRLKAKGEGFVTYDDDPKVDQDESTLPPAWKGYLCVASIIGLSLLFQGFGIAAIQATTYAQVLSILLLFLLVGKKHLANPFQTCVRGIQGSLIPVVFISIVVSHSCNQLAGGEGAGYEHAPLPAHLCGGQSAGRYDGQRHRRRHPVHAELWLHHPEQPCHQCGRFAPHRRHLRRWFRFPAPQRSHRIPAVCLQALLQGRLFPAVYDVCAGQLVGWPAGSHAGHRPLLTPAWGRDARPACFVHSDYMIQILGGNNHGKALS